MDIVKETIRQEFILSGVRPKDLVEMNNREMEALKEGWKAQLVILGRKMEDITKLGSEQYLKYRMGEMDEACFKREKKENDKSAASIREEIRAVSEKLRTIDSETARKNHFLRTLMKGSGKGEVTKEIVRTLIEKIEVYPEHRVKITFAFKKSELLAGKEGI